MMVPGPSLLSLNLVAISVIAIAKTILPKIKARTIIAFFFFNLPHPYSCFIAHKLKIVKKKKPLVFYPNGFFFTIKCRTILRPMIMRKEIEESLPYYSKHSGNPLLSFNLSTKSFCFFIFHCSSNQYLDCSYKNIMAIINISPPKIEPLRRV